MEYAKKCVYDAKQDLSTVIVISNDMVRDFVTRVHRLKSRDDKLSPQIRKACDYIALHPEQKPDIHSLAEMLGHTDYYFSNKFKQETGKSVQEYMPNYLAYLEENSDLQEYAITNVDGEEKYLGILSLYDEAEANYWGHCYRRDWIVKYGTNPETGEAFTGGFTDADDAVFPSGGSDPVYISDWEWMFEIFTTAMEDFGITDGYCYTVPYNGYLATGELTASFGGGASGYCSGHWKMKCGLDRP